MKAITLWQPYATVIAIGAKRFETRHWPTNYRGPIAIHAAKRKMTEDDMYPAAIARLHGYRVPKFGDWPLGAIVATASIDDCLFMTDQMIGEQTSLERAAGNWSPGRYAWQLGNVRALPEPIPAMGHQGFWNWEPPEGFTL